MIAIAPPAFSLQTSAFSLLLSDYTTPCPLDQTVLYRGLIQQYFDQLNNQLESLGGNVGQLLSRVLQSAAQGGGKQHWMELMLTLEQRA